jgi:hypothetical protein
MSCPKNQQKSADENAVINKYIDVVSTVKRLYSQYSMIQQKQLALYPSNNFLAPNPGQIPSSRNCTYNTRKKDLEQTSKASPSEINVAK